MNKLLLTLAACLLVTTSTCAQEERPSASLYLTTVASPGTFVPFAIGAPGVSLPVRWGMDTAWNSSQNMRMGINHIGKRNLSMVRGCFRTDIALVGDTALTNSQINVLNRRISTTNLISDSCDLILNSDQEAGVADYYCTSNKANIDHWVATIAATTRYIQSHFPKHRVIALSPFNEPDYTSWNQGSKTDFNAIAKRLKELFPDIAITAGNTLNCDQALSWYNAVKPYADWGNTHQLAGTFATYASFFTRVRQDGAYAYADELHNVGEAIVGAAYGMQAGVWWGFDSRARGEFCNISNHGVRIGYAENRDAWTAAAVYRDTETGLSKAFIGSSERQANNSAYTFVSTDRDVYFEGEGPQRTYRMTIPGGTGYQNGQTNAERVINIDYGRDVPPSPLPAGTYKLMNRATQFVAAVNGTYGGQTNISQMRYTGLAAQKWNIERVDERIGGDYSFYTITSEYNGRHINVLNNSTDVANVISYDANNASNEQWYFEYAGDGCYFIRNRLSALYLEVETAATSNGVNIRQNVKATNINGLRRQMWRILPLNAECEVDAPATPQGLTVQAQRASVVLSWEPNAESDLAGYMVLRSERDADNWNTIARKVRGTRFVDNTCRQGVDYEYQLKAIDLSENQSEPTASVYAAPTGEAGLVARWDFEDNLYDTTENLFDAVSSVAAPQYMSEHASGEKALRFDGSTSYVQLPYDVAKTDAMTVSAWVYWQSSTTASQRLFDFGNGADQYFYLTPNTSRYVTFVINDGQGERSLASTARFSLRRWTHVAVALSSSGTAIYVNGQEVASSSDIALRPADIETVLNYLGRGQAASAPMFYGCLDDVRIYNRALSADEVQAVMDDVTNGIETPQAPAEAAAADTYYRTDGVKARTTDRGLLIRRDATGQGSTIIRR